MPSASNPFVAGKTYTPYWISQVPLDPMSECLYADYKTVVMRWTNGTVLAGSPEKFFAEGWKEVVIPFWEVGKMYVGAATLRDYECLWTDGKYAALLWNTDAGEPRVQVAKEPNYYHKGK